MFEWESHLARLFFDKNDKINTGVMSPPPLIGKIDAFFVGYLKNEKN